MDLDQEPNLGKAHLLYVMKHVRVYVKHHIHAKTRGKYFSLLLCSF